MYAQKRRKDKGCCGWVLKGDKDYRKSGEIGMDERIC